MFGDEKKEIYYGPARGLYRPQRFMFFLDNGQSGSHPLPIDAKPFKFGTDLVHLADSLQTQVWHVHYLGVTVRYKKEEDIAKVVLFGEYIAKFRSSEIIPLNEVERIILEEAKHPKYALLEQRLK